MKMLRFFSMFSISVMVFAQNNIVQKPTELLSPEEKFLKAIQAEDYETVEQFLVDELIDLKGFYKDKTFLIHACISNKAEMVRLLYSYGADPTQRCNQGHSPQEHAIAQNAFQAAAEIVVIIS